MEKEIFDKVDSIPGTFKTHELELFDLILNANDSVINYDHLGTFGISKGKILALLANHIRKDEKLFAIDSAPVTDSYKNEIIDSIKKTSNMMLKDFCFISNDIFKVNIPITINDTYFYRNLRFLFINANKSGTDVFDMLYKSLNLIDENGIIAIKDWNKSFGLLESLFHYLRYDFDPFLIYENYIFICRKSKADWWIWLLSDKLKEKYKNLWVLEKNLTRNIIQISSLKPIGNYRNL